MHTSRVPQALAAVAGTARAMRRHKRRTVAAGVALLLVTPLLTGVGVDAITVNALALGVGALMLRRFMGARKQETGDTSTTAIESRKENTMTTAVMNNERW